MYIPFILIFFVLSYLLLLITPVEAGTYLSKINTHDFTSEGFQNAHVCATNSAGTIFWCGSSAVEDVFSLNLSPISYRSKAIGTASKYMTFCGYHEPSDRLICPLSMTSTANVFVGTTMASAGTVDLSGTGLMFLMVGRPAFVFGDFFYTVIGTSTTQLVQIRVSDLNVMATRSLSAEGFAACASPDKPNYLLVGIGALSAQAQYTSWDISGTTIGTSAVSTIALDTSLETAAWTCRATGNYVYHTSEEASNRLVRISITPLARVDFLALSFDAQSYTGLSTDGLFLFVGEKASNRLTAVDLTSFTEIGTPLVFTTSLRSRPEVLPDNRIIISSLTYNVEEIQFTPPTTSSTTTTTSTTSTTTSTTSTTTTTTSTTTTTTTTTSTTGEPDEPVIEEQNPQTQTDASSPPPYDIESIAGNIFMAPGFISSSCNNTQVKSVVQKCIDDFHICYGNTRLDLNEAPCPGTLRGCVVSYSKCLLTEGKTLLNSSATSCPWASAFFSAGMNAAASGSHSSDLYDCTVFVNTFAVRYFNCLPKIPEICSEVVNLFAADAKANSPQAIKEADLTQTKETEFPRGMLPIVVSKNETAKECTRPYFDSRCRCPLGFKRMRLFEPSYLFAGPLEPEKRKASNYDVCYDRSVPLLENVSFEVAPIVRSTAFQSISMEEGEDDDDDSKDRRRADSSVVHQSDAQCTGQGQTLRELKVLAENSAALPKGRILAICAPHDTNVFILNSLNGNCYSPRANVSCSCGSPDATSIGVPITYLNASTNVADPGILIICNYPLPKQISTQQAVTVGITGISAASSGPQAQGLQAAAVISLLDCQSEDSEAQQQGGRFALVPGQVGDTEAGGMIFILVVVFGTLFGYFLVCLVLAIFRYNSCCCNFCSGHDKADPALTVNPERSAYKKLVKAHRERKHAAQLADAAAVDEEEKNKNRKKQEEIQHLINNESASDKDELDDETQQHEQEQEEEEQDPPGLPPVEAWDRHGNLLIRKAVEKTMNDKLIITYMNEETGEKKKKVLRAKFKYEHLDNKRLGFFYHLTTAFATMRFPGLFTFTILKFFFQGLAYEAIYLTTREEPGSFTHSLGVFGCVVTAFIVIMFIILGRVLDQREYISYAQYKYLYQDWTGFPRWLIAPDGMWPDEDRAYRNGLAWDDYSGNCKSLTIAVPLAYIKGLVLAVLTAPPWSFATCQYIYWVLIGVFILCGMLLVILRPVYRFPLATFTDALIGTLTGVGLLLYILELPGQAEVYLGIIYVGLAMTIVMNVLGFHEFFVGFCVEVDDDEDDGEDWETDLDEDEGTVRRDQPKMKDLVEEFRDDEEMKHTVTIVEQIPSRGEFKSGGTLLEVVEEEFVLVDEVIVTSAEGQSTPTPKQIRVVEPESDSRTKQQNQERRQVYVDEKNDNNNKDNSNQITNNTNTTNNSGNQNKYAVVEKKTTPSTVDDNDKDVVDDLDDSDYDIEEYKKHVPKFIKMIESSPSFTASTSSPSHIERSSSPTMSTNNKNTSNNNYLSSNYTNNTNINNSASLNTSTHVSASSTSLTVSGAVAAAAVAENIVEKKEKKSKKEKKEKKEKKDKKKKKDATTTEDDYISIENIE